jgi:hypothetical protein
MPAAADVDRHGIRSVLLDDAAQRSGDLVEGLPGLAGLEAGVRPRQRVQEPIGMVEPLDLRAPLLAGVASRDRIVAISAHGDDAPVVDIHLHSAEDVAEAAEGLLRFNHESPPAGAGPAPKVGARRRASRSESLARCA